MSEMLLDWIERYPIVSIEDPLAEDDVEGWAAFTRAARHRVQVIGDDLLVTNAKRVEEAAAGGTCNAVLVKVNQAGTLTRARAALDAAKAAGFGTIVSARSGESEDTSIAHLAVGWNAGQLKVARSHAANGSRNGTSSCASRTRWAATRGSRAWRRCHPENRDVPYYKAANF